MKSSIYAIRIGEFIKVGVAVNVARRMKVLQTANPAPAELLATWPVPAKMAYGVEAAAHGLLADYRHRNEWFAAPLATIREAVEKAIAAVSADPELWTAGVAGSGKRDPFEIGQMVRDQVEARTAGRLARLRQRNRARL